MGKVGTYLYFNGNTLEAFEFYRSVFGGDFSGIMRYGDNPQAMEAMGISDDQKDLVMHISLPILDGHLLMGSDMPERVSNGNNFSITLEPSTPEQTQQLFSAISAGGNVELELHETFWGSLHGSCRDKYGVSWMFDFPLTQETP
jgi:PhnB protein